METDPPTHPRVSPRAKRWFNWTLTGIWLVGLTVMLEIMHTGWWPPIALLGAVLVVELAFIRWNEGHWPASGS